MYRIRSDLKPFPIMSLKLPSRIKLSNDNLYQSKQRNQSCDLLNLVESVVAGCNSEKRGGCSDHRASSARRCGREEWTVTRGWRSAGGERYRDARQICQRSVRPAVQHDRDADLPDSGQRLPQPSTPIHPWYTGQSFIFDISVSKIIKQLTFINILLYPITILNYFQSKLRKI